MNFHDVNTVPEDLRITRDGAILEIVLNRPDQRNALTPEQIHVLNELLRRPLQEDGLRAVILTGSGNRAFCAGFDIGRIESPGRSDSGDERDLVDGLATAVRELPLPVVAAVNGAAVGAGCDLAVACDIRLGILSTRFGMPPVRLGLLYGWKGVDRLVRTVGLSAAKEMLLTGELYGAERAYDVGLLNAIVAEGDLIQEARQTARLLARNAPLSVAASKRMVDLLSSHDGLTDDQLIELAEIQRTVWESEDAIEGARAYREGREPKFEGR